MKKETTSKILRILGWLNVISVVLLFGFAFFVMANSNNEIVTEIIKSANIQESGSLSAITTLQISLFTVATAELIQTILLFRAAKDGKKSTFLIVITIIGVIGGIFTLFKSFNISNLYSILFDIFVLYLLFNGRKEN